MPIQIEKQEMIIVSNDSFITNKTVETLEKKLNEEEKELFNRWVNLINYNKKVV
jgi:hypothetical protein